MVGPTEEETRYCCQSENEEVEEVGSSMGVIDCQYTRQMCTQKVSKKDGTTPMRMNVDCKR